MEEKLVYKKYKTEEERKIVEEDATLYFNELLNGLKDKDVFECVCYTESFLSNKYIKDRKRYEENLMQGIITKEPKLVKVVNPYYKEIFISKLKSLAKENNLNIEIKMVYDKEKQDWYYNSSLETPLYFEKTYGYTLEEFYKIEEEEKLEKKKVLFRNELTTLRNCLRKEIKLIQDVEEITNVYEKYYIAFTEILKKYNYLNEEFIDKLFEVDETAKMLKLKLN